MQIDLIKIGERAMKILPWVIVLVLASMLFTECDDNKVLEKNLKYQTTATTYYKNKLGSVSASNEALQYTKKQLKENLLQKDDSLKKLASEFAKVKSIVKWKTKTEIDSILVPFEVKAPCDFERSGITQNKWYEFNWKANQDGFKVSDFKTFNETTVITGMKRKWFWGPQTITTDITNTSPYYKLPENLQSIETKEEVKWYQSTLFKFGLGAIAGYLITK